MICAALSIQFTKPKHIITPKPPTKVASMKCKAYVLRNQEIPQCGIQVTLLNPSQQVHTHHSTQQTKSRSDHFQSGRRQ